MSSTTDLLRAAKFGLLVLREHREDLCDLDGGWLQDKAIECGLLESVTVIESCGEDCRCVEYHGEFPCECLRLTDEAQEMMKELLIW